MTDLMNFIWRVHDEASDTAGVAGPKADTDNPSVEGPVRGHAEGHKGFVIGHVEDGVSIHRSERDADHWQAAIIGSVQGSTKGFVGHDGCVADFQMLNRYEDEQG